MEKLSVPLNELKERIRGVQEQVRQAACRSGRKPEDITLLAATKTQPAQVINEAIACGIRCIGENRVQELVDKYDDIQKDGVSVQFIGRLQLNKVKYLVDKVDLIHSVDRVELAGEIDRQCAKAGKIMPVLAEVNVGGEASKGGIPLENVEDFLLEITKFPHIRVKGLMTIPPVCQSAEESRYFFNKLHKVFLDMQGKKIDNMTMEILSMGMSHDYACAIECGATMVRVGTAIFGPRI